MTRRMILVVPVLTGVVLYSEHRTREVSAAEGTAEMAIRRHALMQWRHDARFGMFIYWGSYAIPAGTWQGKPIGGIGEWIMDRANVPVGECGKLAAQFNAVQYDPADSGRIAKRAGMKHIVITPKHHDGLYLFRSKATAGPPTTDLQFPPS